MRVILLVPLLALFAFVATTEERAEAEDVATRVEGENFDEQPIGTSVVTNTTLYAPPNGQALKFTNNTATAIKREVTFNSQGDVMLWARGGQSGGSPTLSVNVDGGAFSTAQPIRNSGAPVAYTYELNVPTGLHTIGVRAGNTGTGRNPFLDFVTFPASGSGGTDPGGDWPPSDCEKDIRPGVDIDTIINNDASVTATTFCVYAGKYTVSTQATLKAGDKLKGEPGTTTTVADTATKPTPVVELVGSGSDNLLRADGNGISISWVDLTRASGTGNGTGAIAAGSAGSDFLVEYSRIHDNASVGISNMKGTVRDSEFFKNSNATSSLGFNGSAVKGITEYEADGVYVHDEQGNGLWCDVGCKNSARPTPDPQLCPTGCFWVHDSVVINSGRAGIRYENSPNEALFQNNEIHGNGRTEWRGGIDIRDSQNATVENNNFGKAIIAGVTYLVNGNRIGVRATDSGRSDRVNLFNVDVRNNNFGLANNVDRDRIVTCGGQVECGPNTNVGTR